MYIDFVQTEFQSGKQPVLSKFFSIILYKDISDDLVFSFQNWSGTVIWGNMKS